jgi:hypothetical protein
VKAKDAEKRDLKGYAELLMEAFVGVVDETAEEKGLKKSEFAQKVWPESSPRAASSRWQTMRTVATNTGRPQGVLISDAQRMAEVLGQDLPYLFLRATLKAKEKAAQGAAGKAVKPMRKRAPSGYTS